MSDHLPIRVVVRPMLAAEHLSYGVPDGSWVVLAHCCGEIDVEIIHRLPEQTAEELAALIESDDLIEVLQAKRRVFSRVAVAIARRRQGTTS